jgi:hypothetical protein
MIMIKQLDEDVYETLMENKVDPHFFAMRWIMLLLC